MDFEGSESDRVEPIEQAPDNRLRIVVTSGDLGRTEVRRRLVENRMSILFDQVEVEDTFSFFKKISGDGHRSYWEQVIPEVIGKFDLKPSAFLTKARTMRPEKPDATVSAFANWVYSLYGRPGEDDDALKRGLEAEKVIFEFCQNSHVGPKEAWTIASPLMLSRRPDGWKLVHQGIHLNDKHVPYFELEELTVRGEPLRASPDLLFRNSQTGHVLIVEMKLSRQSIPSNLWPNIWAQLWCYSRIPTVMQAPSVTVTGEVWAEGSLKPYRRSPSIPALYLRAIARRDPRDAAYDRFFRELFEIYRGG